MIQKKILFFNNNYLEKKNLSSIQSQLKKNNICIIKDVLNKKTINEIKRYLTNLGKYNFSNYYPIKIGCPNHYRINFNDQRSYIKGLFHQFNFFNWNQDSLNLYSIFKKLFVFKNKLNNLNDYQYFNPKNNNDFTIRLSFQLYPKGGGFLEKHSDPVDEHQTYLMIVQLSKKNKEFSKGGLTVTINNNSFNIDDVTNPGDLVFFNANLPHEVKEIDPHLSKKNHNLFEGRWMGLIATNKLLNNTKVKNSKKL